MYKTIAPVVKYNEVIEFFVEKWAPMVDKIHLKNSKGGIIVEFLQCVLEAVNDLPTHEVCSKLA
jgi:hypothetical protein